MRNVHLLQVRAARLEEEALRAPFSVEGSSRVFVVGEDNTFYVWSLESNQVGASPSVLALEVKSVD